MKALGRTMDPRKVGGTYRSGYWHKTYTVEAIEERNGTKWFTVKWEDGSVSTHCTAWNRYDLVITQA